MTRATIEPDKLQSALREVEHTFCGEQRAELRNVIFKEARQLAHQGGDDETLRLIRDLIAQRTPADERNLLYMPAARLAVASKDLIEKVRTVHILAGEMKTGIAIEGVYGGNTATLELTRAACAFAAATDLLAQNSALPTYDIVEHLTALCEHYTRLQEEDSALKGNTPARRFINNGIEVLVRHPQVSLPPEVEKFAAFVPWKEPKPETDWPPVKKESPFWRKGPPIRRKDSLRKGGPHAPPPLAGRSPLRKMQGWE